MDTHDVSKAPEYLQYLRGYKLTLQHAQSRKGERPRATKSREEIVMQFMFRQMKNKTPGSYGFIRSSFVPPAYYPCITPLRSLKKVLIRDLTLETHHRGSYILLRAVTPTDTMTAIMAIVEDENENVLMLQLYNQEEKLSADGRLVKGTVILVKEPYLKVMSDGDYGIRVDHLSDVIFLPEHDDRVPIAWRPRIMETDTSVNDWKLRGNDHFNKDNFHLAIECYSRALNSSPMKNEALTIQLNRALTFLKTHQFDAAFRDLEVPSSGSNPSEKALFRKSQALYHLRRFPESCEVHEVLAKEYPNNTAAKGEFNRAMARLKEQDSGKYTFNHLQREALKRRPPHLDRATYIGPVSVRSTETRGRGLFTADAVKAGDLLFCEKAFAHAFYDADDSSASIALLINAQTEKITMGTQTELIGLIVRKLYTNPSVMSTFTDLYHGSYKPVSVTEVDGAPVVDTFLAERIMSLNVFGCPLSTRDSHIRSRRDEKSETANKTFHSCGVWPVASYINHSCYSNARRSFIGDMMIVRATQDLPPNTEITFWYQSPLNRSNDKQMNLQHWGFKCTCAICQDLLKTKQSDLLQRQKLRADLKKLFQSRGNPKTAKIETALSTIAKTYTQPACEVPRLSVWDGYSSLTMIYAAHNQPEKAVRSALKTLDSLGYVVEGGQLPHTPGKPLVVKKWGLMTDELIGCWMCLSGAYGVVAPELEAQVEGYARITYRICLGEDETFNETYNKHSMRPDCFLDGAK